MLMWPPNHPHKKQSEPRINIESNLTIHGEFEVTTQTFKQAYDVLQRHAQTLRNSTEPNIDDLLAIVNESSQAYKVCKARIDAVEKALAQAMSEQDLDIDLTDVPTQPNDQNDGTQPPITPASDYSEIDEGDVPFWASFENLASLCSELLIKLTTFWVFLCAG